MTEKFDTLNGWRTTDLWGCQKTFPTYLTTTLLNIEYFRQTLSFLCLTSSVLCYFLTAPCFPLSALPFSFVITLFTFVSTVFNFVNYCFYTVALGKTHAVQCPTAGAGKVWHPDHKKQKNFSTPVTEEEVHQGSQKSVPFPWWTEKVITGDCPLTSRWGCGTLKQKYFQQRKQNLYSVDIPISQRKGIPWKWTSKRLMAFWQDVPSKLFLLLHCKKKVAIFLPQAGMSITKHYQYWREII